MTVCEALSLFGRFQFLFIVVLSILFLVGDFDLANIKSHVFTGGPGVG